MLIPVTINGYPVTGIGFEAFYDCTNLTRVVIPNSVTSIGPEAFGGCTGLTNVTIPNSVTNIGALMFYECSNLTSVAIPDSVTSIGNNAFFVCTSLTSVTIPNSVTSIGQQAFAACFSLTNIAVVAGNPDYSSVNGVLFDQTQATLIAYPGGLFGGYTIPSSVTAIGEVAFYDCTNLTSVTIPNNVTTIGYAAFRSCFSLTNITVVAGNPDYSSVNGVLFDQTQATLITYPGGLGGGYSLPNSVTTIGEPGFADCFYLTSVTIPNSVTNIGEQAFAACFSLTNIAVVAGNPDYSSVNGVLFDQMQATLIEYPEGLGGGYSIPNSVTTIGEPGFFDCTSLTSVTIPNSITSIRVAAFSDCPRLNSAYFLGNAPPENGTVFGGDSATVYYLAGTTGWGATFGGVPTVLWNPQAQVPGVTAGQFGFGITGPAKTAIVVEACTNLANPVWLPVVTNTLSGTGSSTFSDPQTGIYPARYYRFSVP